MLPPRRLNEVEPWEPPRSVKSGVHREPCVASVFVAVRRPGVGPVRTGDEAPYSASCGEPPRSQRAEGQKVESARHRRRHRGFKPVHDPFTTDSRVADRVLRFDVEDGGGASRERRARRTRAAVRSRAHRVEDQRRIVLRVRGGCSPRRRLPLPHGL